jgi:hypothetical protein
MTFARPVVTVSKGTLCFGNWVYLCLQVKCGKVSAELGATKRDVFGHRLALLWQHPVLQTYFQNTERWGMFRNHILSRTACLADLCILLVWIDI